VSELILAVCASTAEQMHALIVLPDCHRDVGDIGGKRVRPVMTVVVAARRLVLAAHVDRDHPAADRRQRPEHGQEVFLAAGVTGEEQRGPAFADAAAGHRLKRRECPAAGLNGDPPYLLRQVEGPWCTHGVAAYPA
jgi:hypothetical protein